jgi:cellulose synthase operon protein C
VLDASTSAPKERAAAPVPLRLVAFRGGLAVELYEPVALGALRVDELTWSLPGVKFPVDLGGGVRSFCRRRGRLQRVVLSLGLFELEKWLTRRLQHNAEVGELLRPIGVWPVPCGLGVGVVGERGTVAVDLLWGPSEAVGEWVLHHPRGVLDKPQPPLVTILGLVTAALGRAVQADGRVLKLGDVAAWLVRTVLPDLGFRLPDVDGVRCSGLEFRGERIVVVIDRGLPPLAAAAEVTRAREFGRLARSGDEALIGGDWSQARRAYVAALESAPRHPELSHTIATIDTHFEERAEAALGMLVESLPAIEFGFVGAFLLAKTGDLDGARLSISKLVSRERFAPLSAAYWLGLGRWLTSTAERLECVELALACSAAFVPARWERFRTRVLLGDVNGAVADAEHLEAGARGADARHLVLVQAATELSNAGFVDAAGKLFERSLRYMPSDPRSSFGVAQSLAEAGKYERAVVLLQRTIELASEDEGLLAEANLALARLLAEHAGDLPAAIARARRVTGLGRTAVDARALESVWRARLGDIAGAALGFSRTAEVIAACSDVLPVRAAFWLKQAAEFCTEQVGDDMAAERYLTQALRFMPKDATIAQAYRTTAARLAQAARKPRLASSGGAVGVSQAHVGSSVNDVPNGGEVILTSIEPRETEVAAGASTVASGTLHVGLAPVDDQPSNAGSQSGADVDNEEENERRVELLRSQLLLSPGAAAQVVDELVVRLHALKRDEEAYALLRAQFDDAIGPERTRIALALRRVVTALIETAIEQGKPEDADLYSLVLASLDG